MKYISEGWRNILYEINDFGSKIEFVQCKMRDQVAIGKMTNIDNYIESIKKLVYEHEHNLNLNLCDIQNDMILNRKTVLDLRKPEKINANELFSKQKVKAI